MGISLKDVFDIFPDARIVPVTRRTPLAVEGFLDKSPRFEKRYESPDGSLAFYFERDSVPWLGDVE